MVTNNYFALEPENGSYKGVVKIPSEISDRWTKIPNKIGSLSELKLWLNENYLGSDCVVILFSIWAGLDVQALNFLIEKSINNSRLKFFYQDQSDSVYMKVFFEDEIFRHSPFILFLSKGKDDVLFNGKIDFNTLEESLARNNTHLPS